jgi:8-oxo-dGTP pyrophosphatase MutT (NUDIX family)
MREFSISAAIIIISSDMKALIIQRNPHDTFPNKWTVPGGKIKDKDGNFANDFCYYPAEFSAIREVKEETGIEIKVEDLQFLCTLYLKEINRFIISFYALSNKKSENIEISLKDNQSYSWIESNEIKDYDFIPDIGGEIEAVYMLLKKKG